jgi:hypothetical protein
LKLLDYIDTTNEDINRLKEARKNIHIGTLLLGLLVILSLIFFEYFLFIGEWHYMDFFSFMAIIYLVLMVGLIIKREIFSIMIFLRTKEKD